MDNVNYFKDLFDSIPDYRKIVLLMFLLKNDIELLTESGLLKSDINRLCKEFKNILIDQNEELLNFIKNQKKSVIEKILHK